jgi:hypothetical protein
MKRRVINTPKGKFKTLEEAGKVYDITKQAMANRIKSTKSKWSGFSYGEVEATEAQAAKIKAVVDRAVAINYIPKVDEIWKSLEVEGHKLLVSADGRILRERLIGNMIVNQQVSDSQCGDGYRSVGLVVDGKTKRLYVHRLVALAHIPNPSHCPQVNHKDFDKTNNDVSNLEWVTAAENVRHYHDNKVTNLSDYKTSSRVDVI